MSNCVMCGIYLPEGAGMVCKQCGRPKPDLMIEHSVTATVITKEKVEEKKVAVRSIKTRAVESLMINTGDVVIEFTGGIFPSLLEAKIKGFE